MSESRIRLLQRTHLLTYGTVDVKRSIFDIFFWIFIWARFIKRRQQKVLLSRLTVLFLLWRFRRYCVYLLIFSTIVFRTLIEGQENHRCRVDRSNCPYYITMVVAGRFHNYHSSSSSDDTTFIDAALVPTTADSVYHQSSSSSSSSSQRIMQQLVAEQYLIVGFWAQRILGIIVVLSSIFMFALAWKRRDRLFHRLVLGTWLLFAFVVLYVPCYAIYRNDMSSTLFFHLFLNNFSTLTSFVLFGLVFVFVCN